MIDTKFWEEQLQILDMEELKEVTKLVNKYKKAADTREEFIDVLKRWAKKFPNAKYFCTGRAWKGAYECEGEWGANSWFDTYNIDDIYDELIDFIEENDDNHGDIDILSAFNSAEEWKNSILNFDIKNNTNDRKQFEKEFQDSKHKPTWSISDAEDLSNGDNMYEFIDLTTGEKKYLYTNDYGN